MTRLGYTSSNPVTATSAGTRTPARCSSRSTPMAIWSFAHTTACGRAVRPSRMRAAAMPLSSEKSPWMTWSMALSGLAATACSNAEYRAGGVRRVLRAGDEAEPVVPVLPDQVPGQRRHAAGVVAEVDVGDGLVAAAGDDDDGQLARPGARRSARSRTSSAMSRPSALPASARTRFSKCSPRLPKVSSRE